MNTSITHLSVMCVGGGGEGVGPICDEDRLPFVASRMVFKCLTAQLNQYVIMIKIRFFSGGASISISTGFFMVRRSVLEMTPSPPPNNIKCGDRF